MRGTLLACRCTKPLTMSNARMWPLRDHLSKFLESAATASIKSPPCTCVLNETLVLVRFWSRIVHKTICFLLAQGQPTCCLGGASSLREYHAGHACFRTQAYRSLVWYSFLTLQDSGCLRMHWFLTLLFALAVWCEDGLQKDHKVIRCQAIHCRVVAWTSSASTLKQRNEQIKIAYTNVGGATDDRCM